MAITAIHRKKPTWPKDPKRPVYKKKHKYETLYVETDGSKPTVKEINAVLHPLEPPVSPKPLSDVERTKSVLAANGISIDALKEVLGIEQE